MERLDQAYLNDLVIKSQHGSSNAFAELYAAAGSRVYTYLVWVLGDKDQAAEKLQETFTHGLGGIAQLHNPGLFMSWISRIAFRLCGQTGEDTPLTAHVLNLPLAESQVLLMHFIQGLSVREAGDILNLNTRTIRRRIRNGKKHLLRSGNSSQELSDAFAAAEAGRDHQRSTGEKLTEQLPDALMASEILEQVFDACKREPNTAPIEALASYSVYRKERFSLQRGIAAGAMLLFLLLPLLFILPVYHVELEKTGERGLPVYRIQVDSLMPVGRVTASLREHRLPVYEADSKQFTVEPTRNGRLIIDVELFNRQGRRTIWEVSDVDASAPKLTGSSSTAETICLRVKDEGIGVSYRGVYAVSASGKVYTPEAADDEQGIIFPYPEEPWDVYIPDHIGNTLHLSLRFE